MPRYSRLGVERAESEHRASGRKRQRVHGEEASLVSAVFLRPHPPRNRHVARPTSVEEGVGITTWNGFFLSAI